MTSPPESKVLGMGGHQVKNLKLPGSARLWLGLSLTNLLIGVLLENRWPIGKWNQTHLNQCLLFLKQAI